ncbi:MAG: TldD/PmbA family protein [Candidatus Methanoperedens sp.]
MNDIFEIARTALKLTRKAGADEAEIYCVKGRSVSVDIQRDTIDLAKESIVSGIGIRAIKNGAVGFSSTNDPERVGEASVLAVSSASVRKADPQWTGLPVKKEPARVNGVFDSKIADTGIEECIDYTMEMISGALSIPSVVPTSGHLSSSSFTYLIINSNGVEIEDSQTMVHASMDNITKEAPLATGSEFDMSHSLDIDFYRIGEKAARLALGSQNGISTQTRDTFVLLEPMAFADILESTLAASINSDNVQKGRSALIGKTGSKIASEELSIIDDGTLPGGIATASSDDEGTPSQRTEVIKNGILLSFLYDSYTAGKEKRESTGNGVRSSFMSTPYTGLRNLVIEHPSFDVVAETADGVIVNSVIGAHTANPISGDFSVEARNSFIIKNGEITSPIKSMMISGNIFEVLQNIDGIGKDVRKIGNIVTPAVRISKMRIIGE